jgi:LacI family transcriptional regulator
LAPGFAQNGMRGRPTVNDVARLAKVGASTVSRHLRGVRVSDGVAQRVQEAITALGYQPDETARALRGGKTRTLGVIIPQVANSFYAQAVQLIEEEARRRGCAVILLTHQEDREQQQMQLATIRRYRTDGLILAPAAGSTVDEIRQAVHGMPIVAIDRMISPEMDSVVLRNRDAARTATEHLLQHGYRRIACVVSRPEITSFQHRWEGYKDAVNAKRLTTRLIEAPTHDQLRYALCATLLERHRPDALLCFSNRATQTVLQSYEEISLPHEARLPLLGFDDFELAALIDPPLSVVRQPMDNMVHHAMNILFERIRGNDSLGPQNIALMGQLIYRRSCGCS